MLTDTDAANRIGQSLKAKDATLFEKVKQWFRDLAAKLREAYKDLHPDSEIAQYAKKTIQQVDGLVQLWADMAVDAAENYRNVDGGSNVSSEESVRYADRQKYNPVRETFAKDRLDQLSEKMGDLFPLSANFKTAIHEDKTPVSNMTVAENSRKKVSGESFFAAAKKAFILEYGKKITFSIKQLGIDATAGTEFALESISKASDPKEKQIILDLTPEFRELIENSRLLAVERTLHNDNKKTSLLCYRLYNAYIREEAHIDSTGNHKTVNVPHIVVFNDVQNLNDAKAHMVTDINDVAISNGHNSSKLKYAVHANGNIITSSISDVYDIVKKINRKKGGILYSTEDDMKYEFKYTERNDGIKYSDRDSAYMDAVKRGDMETAQKMVEQAAKDSGYTRLFYHGSKKGGGFTIFRDWQYFTENKEYAKRYTEKGKAESLYTTYVKMDNPFDTRITEVRKLFRGARMEYGMGELQENGLPDWTDGYGIADYIDENDLPYDSIVLDEGGDMVNGKPVSRGLSYVIRKSNQIKSADTITYDDSGNVIPLSQRFNTQNNDIRYSQRQQDQPAALEKQNGKLREDVERLRELLKLQGKTTGGKLFKPESIKTAANFIMRETGRSLDADRKAEFAGILTKAYTALSDENVTYDDIYPGVHERCPVAGRERRDTGRT